MTFADFPHLRMSCQRLSHPAASSADLVQEMCALQGQDYAGALWSIGIRSGAATGESVERAFEERRIIRTWAMRGTLHVVAADDVEWLLSLLSAKIVKSAATRYRQLELDLPTFTRSLGVMERSLRDGAALTRDELRAALEEEGISTAGQRFSHIVQRAALEQLICFGPRRGKQHTFVLLDDWVDSGTTRDRNEALRDLALRYFSTRGPASLQDFRWWSGLAAKDARNAVEAASADLTHEAVDGASYWLTTPRRDASVPRPAHPVRNSGIPAGYGTATHLLPMFDEYILAYKDRDAVIPRARMQEITGLNGMFRWTIVREGRIIGVWKRSLQKGAAAFEFEFFQPQEERAMDELADAARRYANFIGLPANLEDAFGPEYRLK